MYTPQSPHIYQRYASLNNSVIQTTPKHARTHSNANIAISSVQQIQRPKVPSQKKLTLTCQTNLPPNVIQRHDGDYHLRKRGGDYKEMKGKFASLQASQVRESQQSTNRQTVQQFQFAQIKMVFAEKFRQLEAAYIASNKQYESQIRLLQLKIFDHSREIQVKTKKIQLLQTACNQYAAKIKKVPQEQSNNTLITKINDLQKKLRVLVLHSQSMKQQQNHSLNNINSKLIGQLGSRISNIRSETQGFIINGLNSMKKLEQKIDSFKWQSEKCSQGTRGSMESFGSEPKYTNIPFHSQNQCGTSFWDDCFFLPSESVKSQNFQLIVQMAKRRQQALSCWIDQYEYLRYSQSNSYIFNRKGDRVRLTKEELGELVSQNLIILL